LFNDQQLTAHPVRLDCLQIKQKGSNVMAASVETNDYGAQWTALEKQGVRKKQQNPIGMFRALRTLPRLS